MKKPPLCLLTGRPALLSLFFILIMIPSYSYADTRYISGIMVVSVRDSIEKSAKNLATVKTGDQVEVLEESGRYARVRTKDNIEGWVSSYFLQTEAPTIDTIIKLKEEIASLKKKDDTGLQADTSADSDLSQKKGLLQSLDSLKAENKRLFEENQKMLHMAQDHQNPAQTQSANTAENDALKEKNASLQNDLDTLMKNSKNIITITRERDDLAGQTASLRAELAKVQKVNQNLQSHAMVDWFIAGAFVFFAGLLSSKFFTRKKSKLSF